jgi:Helix-turn-helix domain
MSMMEITARSASPTNPSSRENRMWHALWLGGYVEHRRAELGLSMTEAAELAGMELSEWGALEAGWVPSDDGVLHAIADTLQVHWPDLRFLAFIADSSQNPV